MFMFSEKLISSIHGLTHNFQHKKNGNIFFLSSFLKIILNFISSLLELHKKKKTRL